MSIRCEEQVGSAATVERETAQRSPGILVVDDDATLLHLFCEHLVDQGWSVWSAATGQEAIDRFRHHADEIDVILLDVILPDLDGLATWRILRQIRPDACCCFMSGSFGQYAEQALLEFGAQRIFPKPFPNTRELVQVLKQLAESSRRSAQSHPKQIDSRD